MTQMGIVRPKGQGMCVCPIIAVTCSSVVPTSIIARLYLPDFSSFSSLEFMVRPFCLITAAFCVKAPLTAYTLNARLSHPLKLDEFIALGKRLSQYQFFKLIAPPAVVLEYCSFGFEPGRRRDYARFLWSGEGIRYTRLLRLVLVRQSCSQLVHSFAIL